MTERTYRVGWYDLEAWSEWQEHQWCEAPVHQTPVATILEAGVPPARYVLIFPGGLPDPDAAGGVVSTDPYFQAICVECLTPIAADLGTTPEAGKIEPRR